MVVKNGHTSRSLIPQACTRQRCDIFSYQAQECLAVSTFNVMSLEMELVAVAAFGLNCG